MEETGKEVENSMLGILNFLWQVNQRKNTLPSFLNATPIHFDASKTIFNLST